MATDPFRLLRAIADHAEVFADGRALAEKAAISVFAAAVKASDKARLAIIYGAIGADAFDQLAGMLKAGDVKVIVDSVEGPARSARTAAAALASLKRIARGIVAPPMFDLATLDLAGLREAYNALGDGFDPWLVKQGAKAKSALPAMDPRFPKAATASAATARSRLAELARGGELTLTPPETIVRLTTLDVEGLRRARSDLGDRFMSWLEAQKSSDLKAALVRIDPMRPNVKKLPKEHYPFLLSEIASGGPLYTKDEDNPPIGQDVFSMRRI